MRKILAFILIAISFSAYSADNAGIYLKSNMAISPEMIKKYASGANIEISKTETGSKFVISWPDVKITINTRNTWPDREVQLNGMYNWISSIQTGSSDTKNLLKLIPQLTNLTGCVIEPSYDSSGKAANLIKGLATEHSGVIFSYQSFYSSQGKWLAGSHLIRSRCKCITNACSRTCKPLRTLQAADARRCTDASRGVLSH